MHRSDDRNTPHYIHTFFYPAAPIEFECFNESTSFLCLNFVQLMPKLLKFDLEPLVSSSVLAKLPLTFL